MTIQYIDKQTLESKTISRVKNVEVIGSFITIIFEDAAMDLHQETIPVTYLVSINKEDF